jgi:hypothetical protein
MGSQPAAAAAGGPSPYAQRQRRRQQQQQQALQQQKQAQQRRVQRQQQQQQIQQQQQQQVQQLPGVVAPVGAPPRVQLQLEYPGNWDYSQPIQRDSEQLPALHDAIYCYNSIQVCVSAYVEKPAMQRKGRVMYTGCGYRQLAVLWQIPVQLLAQVMTSRTQDM